MKEIPHISQPLEYTEADFRDVKFVEIVSNEMFEVAMQYPLLGMVNAVEPCVVREDVYNMLCQAYKKLPKGYKFKIMDGWRPFALQQELYKEYSQNIEEEFNLKNCTKEQRDSVIKRFVSEPVDNRAFPPVHTTGGAVDLTILDAEGKELCMGSEFDEFSARTNTNYFETEKDDQIRNNRRLLYNVMIEAGFVNLPSEWWHYDYGDRFWAYYMDKPAIYEGCFTWEEVNERISQKQGRGL